MSDNTERLDKLVARHMYAAGMTTTGMESFSVSNVPKMVSDLFSAVYTKTFIKEFSDRLVSLFSFTPSPHTIQLRPLGRDIEQWMLRNSYIAIGDISIYKPKGMCVDYLTYIKALQDEGKVISRISQDLLKPTISYLGLLINNPSLLNTASNINFGDGKATLLDLNIDKVIAPVKKCFDADDYSTTLPFKEGFARIADMDVAIKLTMGLEDESKRHGASDVLGEVKTIVTLTEKLADKVRSDTEYQGIRKTVANEISNRVYQIACWVELYAVYQRQIMVLSAALSDSSTKIEEVSKK